MQRSFDPTYFIELSNDRDLWSYDEDKVGDNIINAVNDTNNVLLMNGFGGILLMRKYHAVYEAHMVFNMAARGEIAQKSVIKGMDYMFIRTDCEKIVNNIKSHNIAAIKLADKLSRKTGSNNECVCHAISMHEWIGKQQPKGWFLTASHNSLDDTAKKISRVSMEMIANGNVNKGIALYNSLALERNMECLNLLQTSPAIARIGDELLEINFKSEMRILPCHKQP